MSEMRPLKKFAEENEIGYRTAYRYWQNGLLEGRKLPSGTILIKGWKNEDASDRSINIKNIIILRKDNTEVKQKLIDLAHSKGYSNLDIKIWGGQIYESNIFLKDILESDYTNFFVYSEQDAFGPNYRNISFLLEKNNISVFALQEKVIPVEEIIKGMILAVSKMLRAAVGMHSHKKEISDIINRLVS